MKKFDLAPSVAKLENCKLVPLQKNAFKKLALLGVN